MEAFTVRDLRERTGELIRGAEQGHLSVITKHGNPVFVAVPFDAVLLDAPCSATGTIRRHPDILHLRRKDDTSTRVALQGKLLDRAARLVAPGGRLVYCTCSLEPEEGEAQVARLLEANRELSRLPIAPGEAGIDAAWITPAGDLRTLPCHLASPEPGLSGLDGFYAARLGKRD